MKTGWYIIQMFALFLSSFLKDYFLNFSFRSMSRSVRISKHFKHVIIRPNACFTIRSKLETRLYHQEYSQYLKYKKQLLQRLYTISPIVTEINIGKRAKMSTGSII